VVFLAVAVAVFSFSVGQDEAVGPLLGIAATTAALGWNLGQE
jgi:hypothetical protein